MDLMDQIIDLLMTAKMGRIGENLQRHFRLLHFSLSLSFPIVLKPAIKG